MTTEIYRAEHFADLGDRLHITRLDAEFLSLWNQFVSLSPRAFYDDLAFEIEGLRLEFWIYPTGTGGTTVTLDELGTEILFGEIAFDFERKAVDLKELRVNPANQGRGLSKLFMRNLVQLSKALDMKGIDLYATEGGAYTFARMGVLPTQEAWLELREQIRRRVDALPLSEAERKHILTLLESDDPKTIWKIADL